MSAWTDFRNHIEDSIGGFFTSLKARVSTMFDAGVDAVTKAIETSAPQFEGDIVAFIKQAAIDAVSAANAVEGDGQAKMAAALTSFGVSLATKGLVLAENIARIILENAVATFKAAAA